MKNKLTYRKATESDLDFLLKLREETMNAHLINAGFKVNDVNHLKGLLYKFDDAKIIQLSSEAIGVLKVSNCDSYFEIVQIQIQITTKYQGQGIGKEVINHVLNKANSCNKNVKLSVLKKNHAIQLYNRLGFKITDKDEHSYIMTNEK